MTQNTYLVDKELVVVSDSPVKIDDYYLNTTDNNFGSPHVEQCDYDHEVVACNDKDLPPCHPIIATTDPSLESVDKFDWPGEVWRPMNEAPKDETTIEALYDGEICLICWSERPVCMGGPTVYNKPGWATAPESDTDSNLPMDEPEAWRQVRPIPTYIEFEPQKVNGKLIVKIVKY